mgnify:FL=1
MAENVKQEKTVEVRPEYRSNYKFMTNILKSSTERQIYVPQLKKITIDGQVTIIRIFVAGGAFSIGLLLFFISLGNVNLIPYTLLPKFLMLIAYTVLICIYLIGSRERSMLSTVLSFLISLAGTKTTNFFSSLGIKKNGIKEDGIIEFDDEISPYGIAVEVVGNLQKTMLPSVSLQNQQLVHDHLVDRSPSGTELMISSIKQTSVEPQQRALKSIIKKYNKPENAGDAWRKVMARSNFDFIEENVKGREYQISQVLILRNETLEAVEKDFQNLQNIAYNGLYARIKRLNTRKDVEKALLPITDVKVRRQRKKTGDNMVAPKKKAKVKIPKKKKVDK